MSLALAFAVAGLILLGCAAAVLVSIARVAEILPAAVPAASETAPAIAGRHGRLHALALRRPH